MVLAHMLYGQAHCLSAEPQALVAVVNHEQLNAIATALVSCMDTKRSATGVSLALVISPMYGDF